LGICSAIAKSYDGIADMLLSSPDIQPTCCFRRRTSSWISAAVAQQFLHLLDRQSGQTTNALTFFGWAARVCFERPSAGHGGRFEAAEL